MQYFLRNKTAHSPKLSDELSEDVLQFGSEVSPHIIFDAADALNLTQRYDGIKRDRSYLSITASSISKVRTYHDSDVRC